MAKARKRAGTKAAGGTRREPKITGIAKRPEEMQRARNEVVNLIVDSSVEMTQRVVRAVREGGSLPALRYLWEVAGLFPIAPEADDSEPDAAKALLQKLGLYDELRRHEAEPEGDVESEESQPEE